MEEDSNVYLFVIPDDQACLEALALGRQYSNLVVKNAKDIHPKPDWLIGVPSLIYGSKLYTGSQVLVFLKSENQSDNPESVLDLAFTSLDDTKESVIVPQGSSSTIGNAILGDFNIPPPVATDTRYSSTTKISDQLLTEYMNRRGNNPQPSVNPDAE
jgi:hypothetical protein